MIAVLPTGSTFLDIREFYGDDNDLKPGKKGISLNKEQVGTPRMIDIQVPT